MDAQSIARGRRQTLRDIERELERREAELEEAQRIARLAFWSVDLPTGRVELSEAALAILGRQRCDVVATLDGVLSLLHPQDCLRALSRLEEVVAGNCTLDDTVRIARPDGTFLHAWFRIHPVVRDEGRVVALRGICQDVTDRIAAEATLRESEEHRRHTVDLSAQVPWTAAPDGRILEVGSRWVEITGTPREAALGVGWTNLLHPDDHDRVVVVWRGSVSSGAPASVDYRLRQCDGSYRWMHASATARREENGRILCWYGSLEDIHDRKLAEERLRASEAFSRSVLESSLDSILVLDLDATILFVNETGAVLAGRQPGDFLGVSWLDMIPPQHRPEAGGAFRAAVSGGGGRFTGFLPTRAGSDAWWDITADPIRSNTGAVERVLVTARDVTEKRAAMLAVDAAHARLAAVLENTADNVLSISRDWRVTYMNGNAVALLGRRLRVGDNLFEIYAEYLGGPVHTAYLAAMSGETAVMPDLFLGNLGIWVDMRLRPTADGISVFLRDVTEAHRARQAITHLAHHDPLTGLANRTRYNEALSTACACPRGAGVLVLDLDLFKEVNDTLGHAVGDALLVQVARRLQAVVGERGVLARLGGDEFAVAVPDGSVDACVALSKNLIACLRGSLSIEGHEVRVGVSVGVAVGSGGEPPEELFKRADIALYQAKAGGRDRHCLYDAGLHQRVVARKSLKADLATAEARGQLSIAYQPMLDLASGRICAREALLRWRHPSRGAVSPFEFIPLAEETGLIVDIGDWVLRNACIEAARWRDGAVVSVNLSPIQFQGGNLPMRVAAALAASGLHPARLELEITESVLLKDTKENVHLLHALKALGARIALDDFGTGFSSLLYLRNFPFDKIKIDRSFIGDIGTGNHSEAIVAAVISLGRELGMTITAEGVETPEQLRWLGRHECHQAQGYLIGRPGPVEDERARSVSARDA